MKTSSFLIIPVAVALSLNSCYREIGLEKYRTTPKLVVNSIAEAGNPVTAAVSRTWFYTDNTPDVTITNAEVSLYINGNFCETLTLVPPDDRHSGYYTSSFVPRAGDRIKIVAASPDYGTAWAEDTVPEIIRIDRIKITRMKEENNGSIIVETDENGNLVSRPLLENVYQYQITFQDRAGRKDYYALCIYQDDFTGTLKDYVFLDFSLDPIFRQQGSILGNVLGYGSDQQWKGNLFTDRLIDGQEYTLTVKECNAANPLENEKRYISLYRLSAAYYQYLRMMYILSEEDDITQGLSQIGIAEPLQNFSNIRGGTGILGASQRADTTILIPAETN